MDDSWDPRSIRNSAKKQHMRESKSVARRQRHTNSATRSGYPAIHPRATIRSPRARAAMPSLMDWIAGCPDRGGRRNEKNIRSLRTRDRSAAQHRSIGHVNPDASLRLDGG
jgi:hypothetical protein